MSEKTKGHWESARGENHRLNSQPGDKWVPDKKQDLLEAAQDVANRAYMEPGARHTLQAAMAGEREYRKVVGELVELVEGISSGEYCDNMHTGLCCIKESSLQRDDILDRLREARP